MCYTVKSIDDIRQLTLATRDLSGLLDLSFLVKKASQALHPLLGTDLAAIVLAKGPKLDAWPSWPGPSTGSRVRVDVALQSIDGARTDGFDNLVQLQKGGIGGRVLAEIQPIVVADFHPGPSLTEDFVDLVLAKEGIRGAAVMPITFGGNVLGVLFCGNRRPGNVGERVMALLSEFAASIAPLIVTATRAERAGELAIQEERQRIAQQLHDTAGQILFDIGLSARRLQEKASIAGNGGTVLALAKEIELEASDAASCLREALHSLLATEEALPVTVRRDTHSFSRRSENPVEVFVVGQPFVTSPAVDGAILAVVREGLHNVEKHAGAASVVLTLFYREGEVGLVIQDDGHGLPPGFSLQPVPGKAGGLGLASLLQKVEGLGGELLLAGNEDGGLSLRVDLPVPTR
jgi:signal transduction histidine kinase